ncbi:MAG: DUF839 domain-containing protein, partial [Planctomycetes bacterium]|nr:DUF839 domain-containing protein [Planctomycetota bacterium]
SGRYIFIPAEVGSGAGVFRYDTQTGQHVTLMQGNGSGTRQSDPAAFDPMNDDFARIDPCTWTPWGTIVTGEETTGGRCFEIMNPLSESGPFNVVWRSNIPAMGHEGQRFDANGVFYIVDENNSGSVYKFVPSTAGDLSQGQTFVLSVNAYLGAADQNWNSAINVGQIRRGSATWVPLTDANGVALTAANPFAFVTTTGGRDAADEVNGTPYGRPEDLTIGRLANGNEIVYFTATSENSVYGIELISTVEARVHLFASRDTVNEANGQPIGNQLSSPDNLAIDAFGNIYVIEDQNPGDVFKCTDADGDGVAESIGRFISLGVGGSEPTGFIVDPTDDFRFIVAIQHPSSGNDAVWSIDTRAFPGTGDDLILAAGVNEAPMIVPGESTKSVRAFNDLNFHVASPSGLFVGSTYFFFFDLYLTGLRPVTGAPFLHADLATAVGVVNTAPSILPSLLPSAGANFMGVLPPGLAGISVIFQAAAASANAKNHFVAVSDGVELQIIL